MTWKGPEVRAAIEAAAVDALEEIDLRIETRAKQELYPGHGKLTGTLQRSIQAGPVVLEEDRVRGKVGTKGVKYAKKIHRRYRYLLVGLAEVKPKAVDILRKHAKRHGNA